MMLTLCTAGLSAHRCAQWRFGVSQCVSAAGRPSPLPRDVGRTSATVAGLLPRLRLCYASRLWDVVMARAGQGNQSWHRQPGRAPLTRCPALPAFAWTGSVACLGGTPGSGCPAGTLESGRTGGTRESVCTGGTLGGWLVLAALRRRQPRCWCPVGTGTRTRPTCWRRVVYARQARPFDSGRPESTASLTPP